LPPARVLYPQPPMSFLFPWMVFFFSLSPPCEARLLSHDRCWGDKFTHFPGCRPGMRCRQSKRFLALSLMVCASRFFFILPHPLSLYVWMSKSFPLSLLPPLSRFNSFLPIVFMGSGSFLHGKSFQVEMKSMMALRPLLFFFQREAFPDAVRGFCRE